MLDKRYRNIAMAVFNGESDAEICKSKNISPEKLIACFDQEEFCEYMELLFKKQSIQTMCRLAQHGSAASNQLVKLLDHEKDEVARKAAVDILGKCIEKLKTTKSNNDEKTQFDCDISENQAMEILTSLAEGIRQPEKISVKKR